MTTLSRSVVSVVSVIVLSGGLAMAVASSPARAFVCTRTPALGPSVFWPQRTVEVRPHGGGAEVGSSALREVLERGATSWTAPDCADIAVVVGDPTLQRIAGFDWHAGSGSPDNENIVLFRSDTPGDPIDEWVHTLGALAITTVTFDASTGKLLDADIEINDTGFDFSACDPEAPGCTVAFDLENTLTHELGHVVGLDHPPNDGEGAFEATMFASASRGDVEKRSLDDDDIAGVCAVYPAGEPVAGECYGVGRPSPSAIRFEETWCAAGGGAGRWWPAGLLGLGLWRRRRWRRPVGASHTWPGASIRTPWSGTRRSIIDRLHSSGEPSGHLRGRGATRRA